MELFKHPLSLASHSHFETDGGLGAPNPPSVAMQLAASELARPPIRIMRIAEVWQVVFQKNQQPV